MPITSEVDKVNDRLKDLFKLDESFVIALNGEWGIGKTHFWNKFVEENLTKKLVCKEVAYVSLFGKNTLSDIESDIVMQVSQTEKIKNFLDSRLGSIGFAGVKVSNVLSLIPKSDFKDIVICFDDFERKSNKLDTKDILGLISQFKEQKNCKIVMIYNQEEIEDKKVLSDYKDKVIDYDLHYRPTVEESFNAVADRLKVFNQYPLEFLTQKGINNIRVIKRLINALNDFEFIVEEVKGYPDIESQIAYEIIRLSIINSKFNDYDLNILKEYLENKYIAGDNEFKKNKDYEEILFYLLDDTEKDFLFVSKVMECVDNYIKNSIVDKEYLQLAINEIKLIENGTKISSETRELNLKFHYELTYSKEEFEADMYSKLQEGGNFIVDILELEVFINYIKKLIKINDNPEYKSFAIEKIKMFIDRKFENGNSYGITSEEEVFIDFDSSLGSYITNKIIEMNAYESGTLERVIDILNNPRRSGEWGLNEAADLENIDRETYKSEIVRSGSFLKSIIHFINWNKNKQDTGYDRFINTITEVLFELKNEVEYGYKIEKVIKFLDLKDPSLEVQEEV
ncbi:MAG: P-loop NTPase fold protein [Aliarcobacter sp.]|nr:P-loop NTPase fold protein [Aliarcobacter sp.]